MTSEFIINVGETDFEYEVLAYSQNIPVVVDFWAEWCKPCKVLGPLLEQLTAEAGGAFRLAKLNIDDNPNLALRFHVRSIPTVKVFVDGEVKSEFVGMQPESRIRDFLQNIMPPSPAQLEVERGNNLITDMRWVEAEDAFRHALQQAHGEPGALLGLSKTLLAQNRPAEALKILLEFPASRQFTQAETLKPLAQALLAYKDGNLPDESDLDAAYTTALRLASRGNLFAALDGLLDILRQNRSYRQGKARATILAILEVMGDDNPETRAYRNELTSILF